MTVTAGGESEAIVWDAEPLVAYLNDEPGSDVVDEYLQLLANGELSAYISPVQLTEVTYIAERLDCATDAGSFIERMRMHGMRITKARDIYTSAARYKLKGHSLGDAYALATAEHNHATLVVGSDSDWDDRGHVEIRRIRDEPA